MKKKNIITLTSLLGMALSVGGGLLLCNKKAEPVKAYSDADGYTATADHFVASFHRNNALRNAYNGDDNEGDSTRAENVTISDLDHTSSVSWKVSVGKYSYDSFRNLKMGNKGKTIENHSDSEFAAIYTATGVSTGHYVSAMYSTSAISNLQDIFASWGPQAGQLHESAFGNIYFLAKKSSSWVLIKSWNAGYGSDDRGSDMKVWNPIVALIDNEKLDTAGFLGEDAQIAIAFDSGTSGSSNSYICLHTLMVNRVASAKATMHYWDKGGNDLELCTYITDTKANNSVKIAMFAKYITQIQIDGGTYSGVTIDGLDVTANFAYGAAKESTYYNQLAYLCSTAGLTISKTPSSSSGRFFGGFGYTKDGAALMVVAIVSVVSISTILLLVVNKKKKLQK